MLGSIQRTHTMAHLSEEERGCHSVGSERNKDCKGVGGRISRRTTTTPLPRPFVSFASHNLTRGRKEESESGKVQRARPRRPEIHRFVLRPLVRPSVLLPDSSLFVRPLALSFARSTVACLPSLAFFPFANFLPARNYPKIYATGSKIGVNECQIEKKTHGSV